MSCNEFDDKILQLVRGQLNKDGEKLWLQPYTLEDGQAGPVPEELILKYSSSLSLSKSIVASALEKLRLHAVQKLASRNHFLKTGVASLKIKIAGSLPSQLQNNVLNLEFGLHVRAIEVRDKVAHHCNVDSGKVKLIGCGRVLEMDRSLSEQNIKHNSQIMVILLNENETEIQYRQDQAAILQATREAAEVLADINDDNDNFSLEIADQFGKPLELPREEKKALTLAMTLNEKGRNLLKQKAYGEALVLFLEADTEFSKCCSDILKLVDNYAVLCLDITWCYLCLKSVTDLPNAVQRLKTCEECFKRSYGENLERLKAVKGDVINTQVLYVRLNLLKAILAYYQNKKDEALTLLEKAENLLKPLQIEDEKLSQVMALGYTPAEARLGLRISQGNPLLAVDYIIRRKEEKADLKKKLKEEHRKKKELKKLGKTVNGEIVNLDFYRMLLNMGFPQGGSKAALQQSNNNISYAVQLLQERPDLLTLPDLESPQMEIEDAVIQKLSSLGFNVDIARRVLQHFKGDMDNAISSLLISGGLLPEDIPSSSSSSETSTPSSSASSTGDEILAKQLEERKKLEQQAFDSLADVIPEDEDDYLDITLEDEASFIHEYKILLDKNLEV